MRAGWAITTGWPTYHYFVGGRSLCGQREFAGPTSGGATTTPLDCRTCTRLLREEGRA